MRGTSAPPAGLATTTYPRRTFVRTAGITAALASTGIAADLFRAIPASAGGTVSFVPTDPDLHLLRRATYGITPNLQKDIRRLGRNRWLEQQLDPTSINDAFVEDYIHDRMPNLNMGLQEAWDTLGGSWDLMVDLGKAAILRAGWSKRQLYEVMVDFWSNHLNITNPHESCWWSRHDYDRKVIRKHTFGKFSNMLRDSALHPAMMMYLNNAESTKDNPNENYGREILELHSVGVDGGYDEDDMRQSTLVLTGYGIDWDTGLYEYHDWAHYTGPVTVMGWSHANASEKKGYDVALKYIDYLAHHPSTATRIATKLCQRFVSDVPPPALVDCARGDLPRPRHRDRAGAAEAVRLVGLQELGRREGSPSLPGRHGHGPRARHQDRGERDGRAAGDVLDARRARRPADGLDPTERLPRLRRRLALGRDHAGSMEHASAAPPGLVGPSASCGSPT